MILKVLVFCGLFATVWNQAVHGKIKGSHEKKDPVLPKIECPGGWDVGTFKCYKIITLPADWISALMYCIVMRSHLLEIDSKEEQKEIRKLFYKNHPHSLPQMRLWIDGSDIATEGQWQWMNFGQNITFTNWYGKKQPPRGHNLRCAMLLGDSFLWGASDCTVKRPFICEANPLRIIPVPKA